MNFDIEKIVLETQKNMKKDLITLLIFFMSGLSLIIITIILAPSVPLPKSQVFYSFSSTSDSLLQLTNHIILYTEESFGYVLFLFCLVYIFLQSFAIPGPIFLSIISGAIFGRWLGLLLVSICATLGSTICYFMSDRLGKGLVVRIFPKGIEKINKVIKENQENLFFYLLFLRVVPIVPNWMINLVSPIIGIPIFPFIIATGVGLIPPNFVHITTGITLKQMQTQGADNNSLFILAAIGVLLLIPVFMKKQKNIDYGKIHSV